MRLRTGGGDGFHRSTGPRRAADAVIVVIVQHGEVCGWTFSDGGTTNAGGCSHHSETTHDINRHVHPHMHTHMNMHMHIGRTTPHHIPSAKPKHIRERTSHNGDAEIVCVRMCAWVLVCVQLRHAAASPTAKADLSPVLPVAAYSDHDGLSAEQSHCHCHHRHHHRRRRRPPLMTARHPAAPCTRLQLRKPPDKMPEHGK